MSNSGGHPSDKGCDLSFTRMRIRNLEPGVVRRRYSHFLKMPFACSGSSGCMGTGSSDLMGTYPNSAKFFPEKESFALLYTFEGRESGQYAIMRGDG